MFLKYRLPFLLWSVIILFLTLSPHSKLPESDALSFLDKLAHAGVFMIWSWLLMWWFKHQKEGATFKNAGLVNLLLLSGIFGLTIESIQYFLPFRQFEWGDLAADVAGGGAGYYIYRIFVK